MALSTFTDGNPLTAAQLNLMVDALDKIAPITDAPAPLFQRRSLDDDTEGTMNTQDRVWRYLILHKAYNTKLYYRYNISEHDDVNNPSITLHVADIQPGYVLSTPNGTNTIDGSINLAERVTKGNTSTPLPIGQVIPGGMFYVVRFELDRGDARHVQLHWLYEGI